MPSLDTVAERRAAWVAALRSGEYQQTMTRLWRHADSEHFPAGFCCLGVACQVAIDAGFPAHWSPDIQVDGAASIQIEGWSEYGVLPDPLLDWLGLSRDEQTHLYKMNDAGKSFAEIADAIEALPVPDNA